MKCIHCAEEIRDDASVCRYCQRPVPRGLEEAFERGEAYVVGRDSRSSFSVWDLNKTGGPIASFEAEDRAWSRFRELERGATPSAVADVTIGRLAAAGGGLLVVLGSFLPWITVSAPFVGTLSRSGVEAGDGVVTAVLGLFATGAGTVRIMKADTPLGVAWIPLTTGVIAGLVAVIDFSDIQGRFAELDVGVGGVGAGLWMVIIGSAVTIYGGISMVREGRSGGVTYTKSPPAVDTEVSVLDGDRRVLGPGPS